MRSSRRCHLHRWAPLTLLLAALAACDGGGDGGGGSGGSGGGTDACALQANPSIALGRGVGGAFVPYSDGEEVGIVIAPQGGYGVPLSIHTIGLYAASDSYPIVEMELRRADMIEGFFQDNPPLGCRAPDDGGLITGMVAGLDPGTYASNDDLLGLDGATMEIRVVVTDDKGGRAETTQLVTMRVGG